MRISEMLRQIAMETRELERHMAEAEVDHDFIEHHADMIVSYGLLLRDTAGTRAHPSSNAQRPHIKHP